MLFSAIQSYYENPTLTIVNILMMIPALLLSLTIHEYAHGRMALALGDKTALMAGRLTLNPIKHLHPIGSLMLLLFGFGYARPVPINPRNFDRVKYKTGMILVSLAGPLSNFIVALIGILGIHICNTIEYYTSSNSVVFIVILYFLVSLVNMNIGLAVFNLIPLPPLDGSKILIIFLPAKAQMWLYRYEQYIQIALFALIWLGVLDTPLFFVRSLILYGFDKLISLIPFLI